MLAAGTMLRSTETSGAQRFSKNWGFGRLFGNYTGYVKLLQICNIHGFLSHQRLTRLSSRPGMSMSALLPPLESFADGDLVFCGL